MCRLRFHLSSLFSLSFPRLTFETNMTDYVDDNPRDLWLCIDGRSSCGLDLFMCIKLYDVITVVLEVSADIIFVSCCIKLLRHR